MAARRAAARAPRGGARSALTGRSVPRPSRARAIAARRGSARRSQASSAPGLYLRSAARACPRAGWGASPGPWASSQLYSAVRAPPMCSAPVGDGAKRTRMKTASSMLIGAHVSPAGGLSKAVERGTERGCEAIQIFNQSPRMWRPTAYDEDDFAAFRDAIKDEQDQGGRDPRRLPAQLRLEDRAIRTKSRTSLIQSLRVGAGIGAAGVVLHPGLGQAGRRRPGDQARRQGDRRGAVRDPSAASCTSRTRPAPAARSGARSRSSRRCSRQPAAARGSASAWTHATCSPRATTSAPPTGSPRRSTSSTESSASSASARCMSTTRRRGSARTAIATRCSAKVSSASGDWRRSSPSPGSSASRSCSRPIRAPSRSRSRSSCASAGRRHASGARRGRATSAARARRNDAGRSGSVPWR